MLASISNCTDKRYYPCNEVHTCHDPSRSPSSLRTGSQGSVWVEHGTRVGAATYPTSNGPAAATSGTGPPRSGLHSAGQKPTNEQRGLTILLA